MPCADIAYYIILVGHIQMTPMHAHIKAGTDTEHAVSQTFAVAE